MGAADRGIPELWSTTSCNSFTEAIAIHGHIASPGGADTSLVWLIQPAGAHTEPPTTPHEGA